MSEGTAAREENKCSLAAELLGCFGELRLRATGTSMLPALWPSDLITIRAEEFDRVAPGDIILYARGNRFFIHRVVKAPVDNGCRTLITRGDALAENDPPVCDHEFLGKAARVHRLGRPVSVRQSRSIWRQVFAAILSRSDFVRRLLLHLHATRTRAMNFHSRVPVGFTQERLPMTTCDGLHR